ncbi:Protein of unknown function [Gryllus bimaculatus]|nr:Protein of unknown function [Gryllus bimaculatus]
MQYKINLNTYFIQHLKMTTFLIESDTTELARILLPFCQDSLYQSKNEYLRQGKYEPSVFDNANRIGDLQRSYTECPDHHINVAKDIKDRVLKSNIFNKGKKFQKNVSAIFQKMLKMSYVKKVNEEGKGEGGEVVFEEIGRKSKNK